MALSRREVLLGIGALAALPLVSRASLQAGKLIGTVHAEDPGSWAVLCLDAHEHPIGYLARLDVYEHRLVGHQVIVEELDAWANGPERPVPTREVEVAHVRIDPTGRGFTGLWEAVGRFDHPQVTWTQERNPGNLMG